MSADGSSHWLPYDFAGVQVGTAEHPSGRTGVTVLTLPPGARTAVDAPGSIVGLSHASPNAQAICLAGGGPAGLGAVAGVVAALSSRQPGPRSGEQPPVSAAALEDFDRRGDHLAPDAAVGRAAVVAAEPGRAKYGRVGAGAATLVGAVGADDSHTAEPAGQGLAFREVGALKVLVVTVVNGLGVIIDRKGAVVRGNLNRTTGVRRHPVADYAQRLFGGSVPALRARGGTLTVAITNARLSDRELAALARQVHASMARAISPFQTGADGDVLFAVATNELDLAGPTGPGWAATASAVGAIASEAAWDAVLRSAQ